jgi:hypothetical protein
MTNAAALFFDDISGPGREPPLDKATGASLRAHARGRSEHCLGRWRRAARTLGRTESFAPIRSCTAALAVGRPRETSAGVIAAVTKAERSREAVAASQPRRRARRETAELRRSPADPIEVHVEAWQTERGGEPDIAEGRGRRSPSCSETRVGDSGSRA